MAIIGLIVILSLLVFGFRFFVQSTMMRMPNSLGLKFKARFFRSGGLVGQIDGISVQAWEYAHGKLHGHHGAYVDGQTDVLVDVPSDALLPAGLRISHEGLVAGLGKAIGMQDIVVDHPKLDKLVVIKGKDPEEVKAFFARPRIAEATYTVFDRYNELVLTDHQLKIRRPEQFTAASELMIISMVQYACALQGRREVSILAINPKRAHTSRKRLNPLIEAGMGDEDFEDNAKFVREAIAQRKAGGSLQASSFDREMPKVDDVAPPSDEYPAERDGSW